MLKVKEINFSYNKATKKVLDNISFAIQKNSCLAILGNNGAGKSTLIKCIDRICPIDKGTIIVNSKNIFEMKGSILAQNIAYVAQSNTHINMTVFDHVLLGRKPYIKWDITSADKQVVLNILKRMKLEELAMRNLAELSGGEAQKVMLARALAQEPKLLLLDEPTSNLDPRNQHEVLQTIKEIAKERNICLSLVIHDLNLAVRYCDYFILLKDSHIYSSGSLDIITPENIRQVYGIHVNIIEHKGIPVVVPLPNKK